MKTWSVERKGKLERVLIFYTGLTVFSLIVYGIASIMSLGLFSYVGFLSVTWILWIPIALIALYRILKSKIAREISLDKEMLLIVFKKDEKLEIPIDNLAYAITHTHSNHVGLTMFKKFEGSRGQDVFKKVTELIGRKVTFSWKKQQLLEIRDAFDEMGITQTKADNQDLPLWERILSN